MRIWNIYLIVVFSILAIVIGVAIYFAWYGAGTEFDKRSEEKREEVPIEDFKSTERDVVTRFRDTGALVTRHQKMEEHPVRTIDATSKPVGDDTLIGFADLEKIETLNLTSSNVTDAGLERVAANKSVKNLHLSATAVTNDGLARLVEAKSLTQLFLRDAKIDDAGAANIAKLPSLLFVDVSGTAITDAGLKSLGESKTLCKVVADSTKASKEKIAELNKVLEKRHPGKFRDPGANITK